MEIKINLLLIFGFALIMMQPGLGHILPFDAKDNGNATALKATVALPGGEATNGTAGASTTITATILMPLTNSTTKHEMPTTKVAATKKPTAALKKPASSSLKGGKGNKGFMDGLLDLEHPMWRMHHKRRCHGPAPTKAPLATSKAPKPYYYYNMAPQHNQELNYGLSPEVLSPELNEELGGNGGAPMNHRLPPLLGMLQSKQHPQHHREKSPLLEFLDDVMELVSANNTKGIDTKPYGYYNKMVSPDGKHEVKEFGLLAPNMMIEGVQQEHNFALPPEAYGLTADVLPPEFVPMKPKNKMHHREKPQHHDFLDGGIDAALRKNYELIERLLEDLEQEDDLLQVIKDATTQMKQAKKDNMQTKHYSPKEELIVSCPIHHEHHPNRNGEMIEEDVVQVNECEAVKVQD